MTLSNDEKIILDLILDKARMEIIKEREQLLRLELMELNLEQIKLLTSRLELIDMLQTYCKQKEV